MDLREHTEHDRISKRFNVLEQELRSSMLILIFISNSLSLSDYLQVFEENEY